MFEWDDEKNAANIRKHGISFEEASVVFQGPHFSRDDDRSGYDEERTITIGMIGFALFVVVVHTDRSGNIRIISARKATKRERKTYDETIRSAT
jgi:uncharacterized DUF497 family protein